MDAVTVEEHVLGATEPDALGAEPAGHARIVRRIGVRAHLEPSTGIGPPEELGEAAIDRRLIGLPRPGIHLHHLARHRREVADEDLARAAVEGDPVALVDLGLADEEALVAQVELDRRAADDGALPHPARHDGGVARHPAAGGEDRFGGDHPMEILRRGLVTDEDDGVPMGRARLRGVGIEDGDPARGPGAGGES